MKFYCLREGMNEDIRNRVDILHKACNARNIEFIDIDALQYNHTKHVPLESGSLFYKVSRGAQRLESLMLNEGLITFYKTNPCLWFYSCTTQFSVVHQKLGLPQPKTIHHITADKQLLRDYVEYLDGFPIIIKVTGGTRGSGILKVDSFSSLVSVAEYVMATGHDAILRQYIETDSSARLMVLGNKVIASLKYQRPEGDFRTNASDKPVISKEEYSIEVQRTAIKSVQSIGVEFGGVDIVFDKDGNHYLLEMNFPTGFQSVPAVCQVDIGGLMMDFLMEKFYVMQSQCKAFALST